MEERPWTLPSGRLRAGQRGLAVSALPIAVAVDHVVLGPLKRLDRPVGSAGSDGAAEEAGSVDAKSECRSSAGGKQSCRGGGHSSRPQIEAGAAYVGPRLIWRIRRGALT
jgi:hypothetical protein